MALKLLNPLNAFDLLKGFETAKLICKCCGEQFPECL